MINMTGYCLRPMKPEDLNFDIHIWGMDLKTVFSELMGTPSHYPFLLEFDHNVVGVCQIIANVDVAWLGLLVIVEEHRRKGLGKMMTEYMVDYAKNLGCRTSILFATDLGEPIYRKVGFVNEHNFLYFAPPLQLPDLDYENIYPITEEDYYTVMRLDREITGEDRSFFLKKHIVKGYKYQKNNIIHGVYLPSLGIGSIIANNDICALNLMKCKIANKQSYFILPEENNLGREILQKWGYRSESVIPRMVLGSAIDSDMSKIFCRGTGYSG